jgi:hypothetical protein
MYSCGRDLHRQDIRSYFGRIDERQDAEVNLQQQFYGHKCERKDSHQTAGLILKDNQ